MAVTLRPLRAEDGDTVLAWRNSEAVAPYMYSEHVITPAEHAGWLARALEADDRRFWVIELDEAGTIRSASGPTTWPIRRRGGAGSGRWSSTWC